MDKELRKLLIYKMTRRKPHRRHRKSRLERLDTWLTTKKAKPVLWVAAWIYGLLILGVIHCLVWLANFLLGLLP